jgi:hypothetical protein
MALSFRLAPDFLPEVEYPNKPFGLFFVIGKDFRFQVVSAGGQRAYTFSFLKAPSSVDSMLGLGMLREVESGSLGLGTRSAFSFYRNLG